MACDMNPVQNGVKSSQHLLLLRHAVRTDRTLQHLHNITHTKAASCRCACIGCSKNARRVRVVKRLLPN